jgi:hypothetical protein
MTWVRIQDEMPEHPKLAKVGPLGLALYVAGLCYCNRHLTDGFIPRARAETLLSWKFYGEPEERNGVTQERMYEIDVSCGMHGEDVTNEFVFGLLCNAGLWDEVAGGYSVHDYLAHQTSRQEVMEKREGVKERVKRFRSNAVGNAGVTPPRSQKSEVRSQKSESSETEGEETPTTLADSGESSGVMVARAPTPKATASKRKDWDDALELLWPDFPRKVGKPAALRAWRAIRPQSQEAFDAIDSGLRRWMDYWRGKDREVICHPATWLNQRRWENEP